jgi:undecaprenyl-diphosphatase
MAVFAAAVIAIPALMVWFDAQEIALMPPRGTASLWPFRVLTDFGKDTYVLMVLLVPMVLATLVTPGLRGTRKQWLLVIGLRLQFLFLALSVPLAVGELVKWIAGRGRPFVGGHANAFNFVPFDGSEAHASFPSAHTITAFALAVAVAAIWPRLRGLMIVYALVIVLTRLVLLAHHPSDVVAGATVGMVGALWVRYWFAVRGLGFAVDDHGVIWTAVDQPSKGVAAGSSAP